MTAYDYYRIGIDIATVVLLPVSGLLYKLTKTIRFNDMAHLDKKIDNVHDGVTRVETSTLRVEDKLDRHLEWHLNQKDK